MRRKKFKDNYIFNSLVELFKHKEEASRHLEKVRINPDFTRKTPQRTDLEFFLPQLCSFYLNNELNEEEEDKILEFLTIACASSFFFAH